MKNACKLDLIRLAIFVGFLGALIACGMWSQQVEASQEVHGNLLGPTDHVVTTSLSADGTSWTDLGGEVEIMGYNRLTLYAVITGGDSTSIDLRVLAKHTSAGADEYEFPLETTSPSVIDIVGQRWHLSNPVDQNLVLQTQLGQGIRYIQIQGRCTASLEPATVALYRVKSFE